MKSFLEEYGLIIVAAIVILAFIAFATVFKGDLIANITALVNDFFSKTGVVVTP